MALELSSPKEFIDILQTKPLEKVIIKKNKNNTKFKICTKGRYYTLVCPEKYHDLIVNSIPDSIHIETIGTSHSYFFFTISSKESLLFV